MYTFSIPRSLISLLSLCAISSALPIPGPRPSPAEQAAQAALQSTAGAVLPQDFPDPAFIKGPDGYYAFATSGNGKKIQIARSPSFTQPTWSMLPNDALPDPGPWTDRTNNIWAPYVYQTTTGTYVMYYSAPPLVDTSKHCLGVATSSNIMGPYIPAQTAFACNIAAGGAIDPSVFRDPKSGNTYVMYKIDGNSLGGDAPTPIMLQQINPADGTSPIGQPKAIFDQDQSSTSDGFLVEAPTMMYSEGTYFLLFSTNDYTTSLYDIRYVTSTSLDTRFPNQQNMLLKTGDGNGVVGPGSCDVHDGMIAFHARVESMPNLQRHMYAGTLSSQGGVLRFNSMI